MEKANILIVEDEPIVALDIKNALAGLGYPSPTVAIDGETAIATVRNGSYGLILMDIRLPGILDGIEAAEIIRDRYGIPLIFISTYADDETIERARLTEPYGYVLKSADRKELHSAIQVALYRNRGERAVREREEFASATLRSIRDAVIRTDHEGTIIGWDGGAEAMFGFQGRDIIGKPFHSLCPEGDVIFSGKRLDGYELHHTEIVMAAGNGREVPVTLMVSAIRKDGESCSPVGYTVVVRDISEQKLVEKTVLEVSARERMRIGQDLHDSLGQQLTGISLRLKAIEKEIASRSPDVAREIADVSALVISAIREAKTLSSGLMPPVLDSYGLGPALEELASTDSELYSMSIRCRVEAPDPVGDEFTESQLYRIAQEALTNAGKHSGASHVELSLEANGPDITLSVSDDGRGLCDDASGGLGLEIMRYRANAIGATFSLSEREGGGTTVCCRRRRGVRNAR